MFKWISAPHVHWIDRQAVWVVKEVGKYVGTNWIDANVNKHSFTTDLYDS